MTLRAAKLWELWQQTRQARETRDLGGFGRSGFGHSPISPGTEASIPPSA
jgi:hypothetical protein